MTVNQGKDKSKKKPGGFLSDIQIPMLRHSGNRTSTSWTMLFITFNVVIIWLCLFIAGIEQVPPFSAAEASILLAPLYTLYFARRWSAEKNNKDSSSQDSLNDDE